MLHATTLQLILQIKNHSVKPNPCLPYRYIDDIDIMSLATTGGGFGGGVGGGGLTLAHQANSVGVPPAQPPPQASATADGITPPPSAGILGADLLDKSQGLTLKNVRNVAHLPIVAVDLFGTEPRVALFPKKPEDPSKGALPLTVSKLQTDIQFQPGDISQKTLRKYLGKSKTFLELESDSLSTKAENSVTIKKPHRWLGIRRISDVPEPLRAGTLIEESASPEIAEEVLQGLGSCVSNSTLDGSVPLGDDFDRAVFKVRLHESKKATTILPEEAVEIVLQQAKRLVATRINASPDDEEIDVYPCAVAVPSYYCHDSSVEALLDAIGGGGVIVQRNVAALAGALLPSLTGEDMPLLTRLNTVHLAMQKEHHKRLLKEPDARFDDEITVLVFGVTDDGIETTAVQISSINNENVSCVFGVFKVLSNVAIQDVDPISKLKSSTSKLEETIDIIAPDADGPAAILLCGTVKEQKEILAEWGKVKNEEWSKVPVFTNVEDCVAKGAGILGAVSHGRLSIVEQSKGQKARAGLAIKVQNVAPVAVGIQMNYHGGNKDKWTPVKAIFDFDRQIPAGPNSIDLNAAECVVYRQGKIDPRSDEEFLKAVKANEGAKGIPQREEAALNLRVRILQKWTRDGEWKQVGDDMEPLVQRNENKDGSVVRVGCERISWELSLNVTGMITTAFLGERYVNSTCLIQNTVCIHFLSLTHIYLSAANQWWLQQSRHETPQFAIT